MDSSLSIEVGENILSPLPIPLPRTRKGVPMEERRRYVRIPENLEISYKVIPAGEKPSSYTTRDVSEGGIRFLVHDFIPKDSRLKIRLALCKDSVVIEALVHLVWINKSMHGDSYEIGVEFLDISQKAAELLANCIKEFLKTRK
jgi:c-di-GMP-binding flagellar brake protein YcgR